MMAIELAKPAENPDAWFFVPGEPCGKGRARSTRSGHHYTPQKTKDYENKVRLFYKQAYGTKQFNGPLRVEIVAYMKRPKKLFTQYPEKRPDADNIAKAILDSLNGLAYHDDSCVVELIVRKVWSHSGADGNVGVIITQIKEWVA